MLHNRATESVEQPTAVLSATVFIVDLFDVHDVERFHRRTVEKTIASIDDGVVCS
ncbi:hypothetical protein LOC70_13150 [Rhodopirellula sp. JC737]|nr:hypothetical protein [Rhodopirellula sp. JC737]